MKDWRNWALALILFTNVLFFLLINARLDTLGAAQLVLKLDHTAMLDDLNLLIDWVQQLLPSEV